MPEAEKIDAESGDIDMLEADLEGVDSVSGRDEAEFVEVVG